MKTKPIVNDKVKVGRMTCKGSKLTLTIEFAEGSDNTAFFSSLGRLLAESFTPEQAQEFVRQCGAILAKIHSTDKQP